MFKQFKLPHEILFVFVLKCILLFCLWFFCFSHPIDKTLAPSDIANHLFHSTLDKHHD